MEPQNSLGFRVLGFTAEGFGFGGSGLGVFYTVLQGFREGFVQA